MLLSYLKSLKRLMLFGIVADFDLKSVAWSVSPFIVAISAFVEYSRTLISRPDLFSDGKKIAAPTFETNALRVFKGFL